MRLYRILTPSLLLASIGIGGCGSTPDYSGCGFCGTPVPEDYELVVEKVQVVGDTLLVQGHVDISELVERRSFRGLENPFRRPNLRAMVSIADRDSSRWNPCAPGLLVESYYGGVLFPDGSFSIRGVYIEDPKAELNVVLYNFGEARAPIDSLVGSPLPRRFETTRQERFRALASRR